ncbi:hypothetical protein AB0D99_10430 [Streptomyces sp. NPDC047971]|uniref:hypothetical protein n=1 Tax=Streptomyces sp. NPDC047971 TaxID=3154499 RepID=UPI0033F4BC33
MTHSPTPTELLALKTANAALLESNDSFCDLVATVVFALGSAQLLQPPETAAELAALRARVTELESEHHTTNEALSEAAEQLRANRDRITELEALEPAPIQACRTCGAGYTYGQPCSNCQFQARMAAELAAQQRQQEDPHESPLHHDYAVSRDLPLPHPTSGSAL